jgi:mannose-1-phosphate guanylyltransferase/mannose-6-phosphate isomerase
MHEIRPFVLSGGAGTRLWPLSREAFPKQFHRLTDSLSLFQETCRRLTGDPFAPLSVLTNHQHRFLVREQLQEIGVNFGDIVLEPVARNTGPAACVAALVAGRADPDALVLLAPSDHAMANKDAFREAVELGIEPAREGKLVTFGVEPDCPHTGYGYIETTPQRRRNVALDVSRFVEKPSRDVAEAYLEEENFYWNAGIFLFAATALLQLFERHAPSILAACRRALNESVQDLEFRSLGDGYAQAPSISLDYAIIEKADNIVCVPLATGWSDVGSWSELWSYSDKDERGNVIKNNGKVTLAGSESCLVYTDDAYVALVGVRDLVVVALRDAVLVLSKDCAEEIKSIVAELRGNGSEITLRHDRVYRPWGWYQGLHRGERYQVKCLMVKPGAKLSLQSHHHRSEHWVVVSGTLEVTKGEETAFLTENQSTYIAVGERHRLSNPGKIPAFLIEVQSGAYLNEDDIVRFEDIYHRGAEE